MSSLWVVPEQHLRNPGKNQVTLGWGWGDRSGADVSFPEVHWAWEAGFRSTGPGDPGDELVSHCSGEEGSSPEEEDGV